MGEYLWFLKPHLRIANKSRSEILLLIFLILWKGESFARVLGFNNPTELQVTSIKMVSVRASINFRLRERS